MRRDQEFLSKNQFLTFKSKHHQKTFGIYSFSSIHSYKSIVFCHWCTTYIISYHIVSFISFSSVFPVVQTLATNLSLLLTDLLLCHHGHHLGLLLNVVRVERNCGACKTNISPFLHLVLLQPDWSTLILQHVATPALLFHKDTSQGTQSPTSCFRRVFIV